MFQILFVCTGNICRSPMAQAIATQMALQRRASQLYAFDSAGTHAVPGRAPMDSRARGVLDKRGYSPARHRSRDLVAGDFVRFDLLLTMDSDATTQLLRRCAPEHAHKIRLLLDFAPGLEGTDVPDPYYGPAAGFDHVLDLCEAGVRGLLDTPFKYDKK